MEIHVLYVLHREKNRVQEYKVIDFQVKRSQMISLQLVSSYCPFSVSSSSVALLDAVKHPSTGNFDQSLIPLVFVYAQVVS